MMNFDDRTGKTQPTIEALEQQATQNLRSRKVVSNGLNPRTATADQIVNSATPKPRSL